MADLRVNTDVMRNGAGTISESGEKIAQTTKKISSLSSQVPDMYDGQLLEQVVPILSSAAADGTKLQGEAERFSGDLNSLARQIDGVMQQGETALSALLGTTVSGSPVGKFFGRASQLALATAAAIMSWIGTRRTIDPLIIPPKPTPGPAPTTREQRERIKRGEELVAKYDGKTYAKSTYDASDSYSSHLVKPPVTNQAGERDPNTYKAVLNQFGVETNPRYKARNDKTYCNIYVWDATRAMGAEIPHWVDAKGNPVGVAQGSELNANSVVAWMSAHGSEHGWHEVTAEVAQAHANTGAPAVVVWASPGPHGHVAMVRPGEYSAEQGPHIAQAGEKNLNNTTVADKDAFYNREVTYYVHD